MKNFWTPAILVMIIATLLWVCATLHQKEFMISGQNLHNAKQLCDQNQGLKAIRIDVYKKSIICHNGSTYDRKRK